VCVRFEFSGWLNVSWSFFVHHFSWIFEHSVFCFPLFNVTWPMANNSLKMVLEPVYIWLSWILSVIQPLRSNFRITLSSPNMVFNFVDLKNDRSIFDPLNYFNHFVCLIHFGLRSLPDFTFGEYQNSFFAMAVSKLNLNVVNLLLLFLFVWSDDFAVLKFRYF